ncbi:MAG TPA: DUF72 domain-containing protein [Gemmataceae bacterium]
MGPGVRGPAVRYAGGWAGGRQERGTYVTLYAGTSGYSYKPWKGKFYPKDLPDRQTLAYYGEHFDAVEINNTFYGLPTPAAVRGWAKDVGGGFRFALKAPQQITHRQRLRDADEAVAQFLRVAATLGKRLGPVLFQLPPNFPKDLPRLRAFLQPLSRRRRRVGFEFRHASWFDDEVFALLRDRRVALCIADDENDLAVPVVATTDWGYLRLRRPAYSDAELATWAERVRGQSWQDAFVFFKHEDTATGPRLARRFLELAGGS